MDIFCGQRGCQRKVPTSDALREYQKIGRDLLMFARKHFSRSAKTRGDFVRDHQNIIFRTEISNGFEKARRGSNHPGNSLDHWLNDNPGYFAMSLS